MPNVCQFFKNTLNIHVKTFSRGCSPCSSPCSIKEQERLVGSESECARLELATKCVGLVYSRHLLSIHQKVIHVTLYVIRLKNCSLGSSKNFNMHYLPILYLKFLFDLVLSYFKSTQN